LRILIAPDKFKGSLDAQAVGEALARGIHAVAGAAWSTHVVPMADGGEGTVDAFVAAGAQRVMASVTGPLGDTVDAAFALDGTTAILEMSAASGLALVAPDRLDARRASTFGTGELIAAALDRGAKRIVIGIGGSATSDGGAGMLEALGARLLDAASLPLGPGGEALNGLARVDLTALDARLAGVEIEAAADVDNPLYGPTGAAVVFGPQKGASPGDVLVLDHALTHFAHVSASALGTDFSGRAGAGAAGGLGFALMAYLGAKLRPGVEIVAELRGLRAALEHADLCITGEGRIDDQTMRGKTVAGVARLARSLAVPVVAVAGSVVAQGEDELARLDIAVLPIAGGPATLDASMAQACDLLERTGARLARLLLLSGRLREPTEPAPPSRA
jgi:glycerate kinase